MPMPVQTEAEVAIHFANLLHITRDLIQIFNDHDEDLGDLPAFYERLERRSKDQIDKIDQLLASS